MKKTLLILCLLALTVSAAFSLVSQRIYPVDSPIYCAIKDIYLVTGHASPSSSGPWSGAELLEMIQAIPRSQVPSYLLEDYDLVMSELDEELSIDLNAISLQFSGNVNLQGFLHTNTDGVEREDVNGITEKAFTGAQWWSYDLVHQEPLVGLDFEFDVSDSLYLFLEAPIMAGFHSSTGYAYEVGASNLGFNIPGLHTTDFNFSMNTNWPLRAYASFGSKAWNVQIGRDRLSWGNGRTGNLVISDNLPYQDMFRLSAFSRSFKYSFLVLNFPHKSLYYSPSYVGSKTTEKKEAQGINLYISHRIEGRLFSDRLSFAMTESIMYSSENGVMDFRALNPAYIFHNLYTASNSNSTAALELDYTPVGGLNLYGQFILDDLALPGGEKGAGPDSVGYPNAMGYILGATYATGLKEGILSVNLEGAYLDPYTYLRYKTDPDNASSEDYGIDNVVAIRDYVSGSVGKDSAIYDEYFLGYTHGNDCVVANLNASWRKANLMSLSANAFFMAHGTHDQWTRWDQIGGNSSTWEQTSVTPTSSHETGSYKYDSVELNKRNAVCFTLDVGLFGSYCITQGIDVYCQLDYLKVWNVYNRSGVDGVDLQIVLGASYRI